MVNCRDVNNCGATSASVMYPSDYLLPMFKELEFSPQVMST